MELGEIRRGTSHTLEVPVAEVNRTWLSGCTKIETTLSPSTRLKTWTLEGTYSDGVITFVFDQETTLDLSIGTLSAQIRAVTADGDCDSTEIHSLTITDSLSDEVLA